MKRFASRLFSVLLCFVIISGNASIGTSNIAQNPKRSSLNWQQIFEISGVDEYSFAKRLDEGYIWADGKVKNQSVNNLSEVVIIMDVDFGDKKRTFEARVYDLTPGQTSDFFLFLNKSEQRKLRKIYNTPIVSVTSIKYFIDEYIIPIEEQKADSISQNTASSTSKAAKILADDFTSSFASGYGKRLEDAYKANKNDSEIAAMYHYHSALFYVEIGDKSQAKLQIRQISPDYSGIMSDEIIKYGISLFGTKEEWEAQSTRESQVKQTVTSSKKGEIKRWIEARYTHYDTAAFSGSKTQVVFKDASSFFDLTVEELMDIWSSPN